MSDGGAFVVGGLVGGVIGGSAGFQAGYQQREQELRPYITSLEQQNRVKDLRIAELERQLKEKNTPLLSSIKQKLGK